MRDTLGEGQQGKTFSLKKNIKDKNQKVRVKGNFLIHRFIVLVYPLCKSPAIFKMINPRVDFSIIRKFLSVFYLHFINNPCMFNSQ